MKLNYWNNYKLSKKNKLTIRIDTNIKHHSEFGLLITNNPASCLEYKIFEIALCLLWLRIYFTHIKK